MPQLPNLFVWDEPSSGEAGSLHFAVVSWFWTLAIHTPRNLSNPLLVQCGDARVAGHLAAWIDEPVHVVGGLVADVDVDVARGTMQHSMEDPMPLGMTPRNLKDCAKMLNEGVPVWQVFDKEFHQQKWEREDKKRAEEEHQRKQREEKRQHDGFTTSLGVGCLLVHDSWF